MDAIIGCVLARALINPFSRALSAASSSLISMVLVMILPVL